MTFIDIVAMTAVLQYLVFGGLVSRARTRHGIKAPAITGHPQFERVHRVHVNTLELLVAFLPALYAAWFTEVELAPNIACSYRPGEPRRC